MDAPYSISDLADTVNRWCAQHRVAPLNGQAATLTSERSIRFYRTIGLVDSPITPQGRNYTDKHRSQLIAIRLLQAQGLPLRRIRDLLFGRTLDELREIEKRGAAEITRASASLPEFAANPGGESWSVAPLSTEFLLVSRSGRLPALKVIQQIQNLLENPSV